MTNEELEKMQEQHDDFVKELLKIVVEDVPLRCQSRLIALLNPICKRCVNQKNISFCIADSSYDIEFDKLGDTITFCTGFMEEI
jgi:hypothetical protein